jgi:poly(3-hydroxybutyrate) depolymerase
VAFISRLLEELSAHLAVDPKQIYASGFSTSPSMTFWLGIVRSDIILAIGPVAGGLPTWLVISKSPLLLRL